MVAKVSVLFALAAMAWPRVASAADECGKAGPGKDCQILIDRTAPVSGRAVKVENETKVTVVLIKKSPFESCKNDVKREELPDVSAIPTILGLVKDLAGSLLLPAGAPATAPVNTPEHIVAMLEAIAKVASAQATAAGDLQKSYDDETDSLKAFYRTKYFRKEYATPPANDETKFETDRAARQTAVEQLAAKPEPNTAAGEATYKAVLDEFSKYAASAAATPAEIQLLEVQINKTRAMLDALAKAVETLDAAHTKLHDTLAYLKQLKDPEFETTAHLTPDRNAKLTGSFSCTSDVSGKPSLDPPVVYTVTYQGTPRLTLSAGVLLSRLPRNSVALESVEDSRVGTVVTEHTEIRDHPSAPQAVPFSFINIRVASPWYWHNRVVTANVTTGLGVNANSGSSRAEFLFGGSVNFGDLSVCLGSHIGHTVSPANDFALNDRPPADLKTVPVEMKWKPAWAFAVSYRVPLK